MPPRIEADHFLIAHPPVSKGPNALLCQLQRLEVTSSTRLHTPAYDLRRSSHVLDPQEAVVTSYEEERLAVFKSPQSKIARRVSQVTKRSKSTSPSTPPHAPLSTRNLNTLGSVYTETPSSGTVRVHYKPGTQGRDWQIHQSSAGFTFSTPFPESSKVKFQLVWTHRYKPQRKTSTSSAYSRASRSNSPSQLGTTSLSAGLGRRRSSLPGLILQAADEWTCRIVDPEKVLAAGASRGVKVARLTLDELILYQLSARSSSGLPIQADACQQSSLSAEQPEHISRTVIMSALWILTHPHDQFLMHGLGHTPDWLQRPRAYSPSSTLPRSRSPLRRIQLDTPESSMHSHSAPMSRDGSPSPASTERALSVESRGRLRDMSNACTITTRSSEASRSPPGRATTMRPTCYSFLNSFKLWKPRSQRQHR